MLTLPGYLYFSLALFSFTGRTNAQTILRPGRSIRMCKVESSAGHEDIHGVREAVHVCEECSLSKVAGS